MKSDNAYYFTSIQKIGGIETFLYQLVKDNQDKNIVIYYQTCDINQLKRLNKYCTLKEYHKGVKIECHKAFFNFNLDPLENGDVIADKRILIVHGNYKWLKGKPPMHEDIDEVYAVSKDSANAYTELTGIPCGVIYNPIKIEQKKTLMLMSATRIDTTTENVKGGSRMIKLANALDKYCKEHDCAYQWHVYSSQDKLKIPNIQVLNPTLDVAQYMPRYDYVIQLSDNFEGYNYTVHEALNQSVPIVATRCDVYVECKIDDSMAIWLDFDCNNIDKVVDDMFNRTFNFKYESPKSNWNKVLQKALRKEEVIKVMMYKVKATAEASKRGLQIAEFGGTPKENDEFLIPEERLTNLLGMNRFGVAFVKDAIAVKDEKEEKPFISDAKVIKKKVKPIVEEVEEESTSALDEIMNKKKSKK